jgi:mRNA interferase HigB
VNFLYLCKNKRTAMKLLKYKMLKDFWKKHPDAEDPLQRWAEYVERKRMEKPRRPEGGFPVS